MNLVVEQTKSLSGTVNAPPSKSYTIRALIASALGRGHSFIKEPLLSLDTKACIDCCKKLGSDIKEDGKGLLIEGNSGFIHTPDEALDAQNSGTSIRLMTGICSLGHKKIDLTGDESIRGRPIEPLLKALEQLGVKTGSTNGFPPHWVKGPLAGGNCKIRGDISSQFLSSLLMSAPLAEKDTSIELTTPLKSKPYVDLTIDILDRFGIIVENENYERFKVPAEQEYKAIQYTIEGDFSSAAFILGAASITEGNITVKNIVRKSKQADKKILGIVVDMGAKLNVNEDFVKMEGTGNLNGITVDLSDAPDLVPITSVLGALAKGETVINNVWHARLKECDRIHAMAQELKKMGANIEEEKDGLVIQGGSLKGCAVEGWKDHRIVMALAIAALKAEGETTISDAEYTDVTFPGFVELMQKLGANVKVSG